MTTTAAAASSPGLPEDRPDRARLDPRLRVVLVVVGCAGAGLVLLLLSLAELFDYAPLDSLPARVLVPRLAYVGMQLALGVVALTVLPFTLRPDPREPDPSATYGPSVPLWCGLVAVAAGAASPLGLPAGLVALVSICSRRSAPWLVAGVGAFVLVATLDLMLSPGGGFAWDLFAVLLAVPLVALALGLARGRRREQHARLLAAATMTREQARERETRAREDERRRIARDLHDSLSHRLSLIAVHAGALEYRDDLDPATVRRQAGTVRGQAELGVGDLRSVLTALQQHPDTVDPGTSVEGLVATARAAGADVTLTRDPDVTEARLAALPTAAQHAVRRTVQEGLTNARKHAPGAPIEVRLGRHDGWLRIEVCNPVAPGAHSPAPGSGLGLVGLEERARLTGGSLRVTAEEVFGLSLEVPCPE